MTINLRSFPAQVSQSVHSSAGVSEREVLSVKLISSAKTEELIAVTLQHSFCLELMGLHPS